MKWGGRMMMMMMMMMMMVMSSYLKTVKTYLVSFIQHKTMLS